MDLIAVIPVDTSGLPPLPPGSPPIPKPSIEHALIRCECGRRCWIGPKQLVQHRIRQVPIACYFCIVDLMRSGELADMDVRSLDPNHDRIPRRT